MKKEQLLTNVIILISAAGIVYFVYLAISETRNPCQDNPFVYDIETYKKYPKELLLYTEAEPIPLPMQNVHAVTLGPENRLYVSGDNNVLILNRDKTVAATISLSDPVYCLAVDNNHILFLGKHNHIEVYDRNHQPKEQWGKIGEKAHITALAVTEKNLFAADAGNLIIWKFDKSGNLLKRIGAKNEAKDIPGFIIPSPYFDIGIDPDGYLWAANTGRLSLENYTLAGDFRSFWGKSSMQIDGFSGCCNPCNFVILDDGSFVTSEKGITRIKVYDRLGRLTSVVAGPDQFIEGTTGLDLAALSSREIFVLDPKKKEIRIFEKNQ